MDKVRFIRQFMEHQGLRRLELILVIISMMMILTLKVLMSKKEIDILFQTSESVLKLECFLLYPQNAFPALQKIKY